MEMVHTPSVDGRAGRCVWCDLKSVRRATRPTDRGAGHAMTVALGSYRISKLHCPPLNVEAGAPNWNVIKRLRALSRQNRK